MSNEEINGHFDFLHLDETTPYLEEIVTRLYTLNTSVYNTRFFQKYPHIKPWDRDLFRSKITKSYPNGIALISGAQIPENIKFWAAFSDLKVGRESGYKKFGIIAYDEEFLGKSRSQVCIKALRKVLENNLDRAVFCAEVPIESYPVRSIFEEAGFHTVKYQPTLSSILEACQIHHLVDTWMIEEDGSLSYESIRSHDGSPYLRQVCYIHDV